MTKNTAHSDCQHPATKAARAKCRREARKITIQNPTADDMIDQLIGTGRAVSENIDRERRAEYAKLVKQVELINAVRDYAADHYEEDGWDVVVEAMDDDQLLDAIGKARTTAGAIKKVHSHVKAYDDYRRDIQGTAF